MIRLIQRRLIIPRGDTGTFTIPTQGTVDTGDKAIFSVVDILTHEVVLKKKIDATNDVLTFSFEHSDTNELDPSHKYVWDIKLYRHPTLDEDGWPIDAEEIDSYYAAFKLPPCEIRPVTYDA